MKCVSSICHGLLLACLCFTPAAADPLLYRLSDGDSRLWLLGSVHALQAADLPLDERIESAYEQAERVVLEIDPAELNSANMSAIAIRRGRFDNGKGLSDVLSDEEHARLKQGLATLGLDARQFEPFEPWFVGLQLLALNLVRHGYDVADGVDRHLGDRALDDGKQTAGLESADEQLRLFDSLTMETQKKFLLEALEDSDDFEEQMNRILAAWRSGDAKALANLADEELGRDPALRDALLVTRNRHWVAQIPEYLDVPGDTLIIVGALHLVGTDGVVAMLREKGYEVAKVANDRPEE